MNQNVKGKNQKRNEYKRKKQKKGKREIKNNIESSEDQELKELNQIIDKANQEYQEKYGLKTMRLETPEYNLEVGLESNIGRREYQQDVSLVSYDNKGGDTKAIAILCDGMGGMNNGEIASNICVNQIFDAYRGREYIEDYNKFLIEEAIKADEYVSSLTDNDGEPLNSGCTLIATIIENKQFYWVSVGDSRIYIIRDDEIAQVTTDHNYSLLLKEQVAKGELTKEEAEHHPKKEALISYIGMCGLKLIDHNVKPLQLKQDDFVLLCSDGLYRSLDEESIKYIIRNNYNNVEMAAKLLVDTAVKNGSLYQDNTSVILIKCI